MWVSICPSVFINQLRYCYIAKSYSATCYQKSLNLFYFFIVHWVFLARAVIYYGLYPCIILINKDYSEFKVKFATAETYVIPVTDFLSILIGVASVLIRYNTKEKRGDFFQITRSVSDLWENDFLAMQ